MTESFSTVEYADNKGGYHRDEPPVVHHSTSVDDYYNDAETVVKSVVVPELPGIVKNKSVESTDYVGNPACCGIKAWLYVYI